MQVNSFLLNIWYSIKKLYFLWSCMIKQDYFQCIKHNIGKLKVLLSIGLDDHGNNDLGSHFLDILWLSLLSYNTSELGKSCYKSIAILVMRKVAHCHNRHFGKVWYCFSMFFNLICFSLWVRLLVIDIILIVRQ